MSKKFLLYLFHSAPLKMYLLPRAFLLLKPVDIFKAGTTVKPFCNISNRVLWHLEVFLLMIFQPVPNPFDSVLIQGNYN